VNVAGDPRQEPPGRSTRARLFHVFRSAFAVAILVGFGHYLWVRRQQLAEALELGWLDLTLLAALTLGSWAAMAGQSVLLYRAAGAALGFGESFLVTAATGFGNYLPMRAGTVIRAHYLRRAHGLAYARFGSILVVRGVLFALATGACGVLATIWVARRDGRFSGELVVLFAAMVGGSLVLWRITPARVTWLPARVGRLAEEFSSGVAALRRSPRVAPAVCALVLVHYGLLGTRFLLAARAVGAEIPLSVLVLLATVGGISGFVAITPGALGVREAVMGFATLAVGAAFAPGIYVGSLDRAVLLGLTATVGLASFLVIWRRLRRLGGERATPPGDPANDGPPTPS
jgi:uncharacterized membrane protein YbhN (UPF0104 family)